MLTMNSNNDEQLGPAEENPQAPKACKKFYQTKKAIQSFCDGLPEMTIEAIKEVALENEGYETPELNDQLYLHYKGYRKIENLDAYTGLKALWLDSNGFQKIENLCHLINLRCLFLQRNLLTKIENLDNLQNLVQLDLSENRITNVSGLSGLPNLITLNLAKNALVESKSINHLSECKRLTTVDLTNNQLRGDGVICTLSGIQCLVALNMTGNPVVTDVAHFRKKCITAIRKLRYLDKPVFDMERATAEAWSSGGRDSELKTKREWQAKQREKERKGIEDFRVWQAEIRRKKQEELKQISEQGPTMEQKVEMERMEKLRKERKEAAAEESRREKEKYAIKKEEENTLEGVNQKAIGNEHASKHDEKDDFINGIESTLERDDTSDHPKNETRCAAVQHQKDVIQTGKNSTNRDRAKIDPIDSVPTLVPESKLVGKITRVETDATQNKNECKKKSSAVEFKAESTQKEASKVPSDGCSGKHHTSQASIVKAESKPAKENAQNVNVTNRNESSENRTSNSENDSAEEMKLRVMQSLEIYRAQKKENGTNDFNNLLRNAIKSRAASFQSLSNETNDEMLWMDDMDTHLTKHIHENLFDFMTVATCM